MALKTELFELTGRPTRVNPSGHALGSPGQILTLANAGDDPIRFLIRGLSPDGTMPGFTLETRSQSVITLPGDDLGLWFWSVGNSRLLITPSTSKSERSLPQATQIRTVDYDPAFMVLNYEPSLKVGDRMLFVNVGPESVYWLQDKESAADIDRNRGNEMKAGEVLDWGVIEARDSGNSLSAWFFADRFRGSTLLIQNCDPNWNI